MGLFSSINKLAKSVGRGLGKIVEEVGDVLGSELLINAGKKIQDVCSEISVEAGKMNILDENSSVEQTSNINEILAKFSFNLEEQADRIERDCLDKAQEYFNELISILEKSDSKIYITRLKTTLKKANERIKGSIKNHLAKRVSLDDHECKKILEMTPSTMKEDEMNKFGKKVVKEALNKLSLELSDLIKDNNTEIQEYFEDIVLGQQIEVEQMQKQLTKILGQADNIVSNNESINIIPKLIIEVNNEVMSKFSEEI